jgi:hypothetical protein
LAAFPCLWIYYIAAFGKCQCPKAALCLLLYYIFSNFVDIAGADGEDYIAGLSLAL